MNPLVCVRWSSAGHGSASRSRSPSRTPSAGPGPRPPRTTTGRGAPRCVKSPEERGELVEWARREGLQLSARDVGSRLDEVRALRDAVFALLLDATREGGVAAAPGTEARLNAALAAVPLVPQLRGGEVVLTA